MSKRFDAIVIGAGLGGLSAATLLAERGLDVLLLERHNVPGGYATSFVRGRYEFEVALHELSGIGTAERRGPLYEYLASLGVTEHVEFVTIPHLHRSVFPEFDLRLPAGFAEYEETLCEAFPAESDGIRRFLQRVRATTKDFGRLVRQRGRLGHPLLVPRRFPALFRYLPATWAEVIEEDVRDPLARAVLGQYWGYVGLPPSRASFVNLALTLYSYAALRPSYPKGRSQALSSAFQAAFERHGGVLRTGRAVTRIVVRDGVVRGVVTASGERYEADWIVSNADPVTTCRALLGEEHLPRGYLRRLASSGLAASTINVYLGLARPPQALSATDHEIFINADSDLEGHAGAARRLGPPREVAVTCYNAVLPDISPPGTSMIVICGLTYGDAWAGIGPEEYVATKTRIAGAMLDLTETVLPGLRDAAEVVEVSTPLTNVRYANTLGGSIYGFDATPWDSMLTRPSNRGPVEGLLFAGAWTRPGGGFEPTIMSGRMAAGAILSARRRRGGARRGR